MRDTRTSIQRRAGWLGMMLLACAATAGAQQPRLSNAKMESRSAAGGLEKEVRAIVAAQNSPAWIAYGVPMIAGERCMCCGNYNDGYVRGGCCNLEGRETAVNITSSDRDAGSGSTVKLEGPQTLFVLFRVEQKQVQKIRTYSEDCQLDAGGLPFIWLSDVRPAESVALLTSFVKSADVESGSEKRIGNGALTAIVFQSDPAADRALESFIAADQPESLRRQTAFWLGSARGKPGFEILKRMARQDPSDRVRDQVTFALSQSKEPGAVDEMIRMAREDSSTHVRSQALFWLGQKAGKKAVGAINDAIENDPNTEIKKKAVFALTQLPHEEGVPMLIQVAKTNKNPEVRKQAMFWLGQSKDPRALDFFEEVLKK
jgi:HEAT repeat protein